MVGDMEQYPAAGSCRCAAANCRHIAAYTLVVLCYNRRFDVQQHAVTPSKLGAAHLDKQPADTHST